jgi:hypoxanthine phosphoribosyltransferase
MTTSESTRLTIQTSDSDVFPLIGEDKLAQRVAAMAREISDDYRDKPLLVVGVLHGAYVFMADLLRQLTIPVRTSFVMVSTYGNRTVSSGQVDLRLDLCEPVDGEHVLLIDDLVDTGVTTDWLIGHLQEKAPASVKLCTLLDKSARRRKSVTVDYVGFEIADHFVVGYGIDYAGRYRELPYVGYVEPPAHS